MLASAFHAGRIGHYQLEAALQSAHVDGVRRGAVDHEALLVLYEGLVTLAPSLGARVGHAAVLAAARGPDAALAALDALDAPARDYQPYWAVRAAVLRSGGQLAAARDAYERAIGMTEDVPTRKFLVAERDVLSSG
jgi:RNA polymerase sigma-70 factor (ECF subfamily)